MRLRQDENVHPMTPSAAVIENFFDEKIGPRLFERILASPPSHLVAAAHAVSANAEHSRSQLHFRRDHDRGGEAAHLFDELYLHDRRAGDAFASSTLKAAILYSERLVLRDPCLDWAEGIINEGEFAEVSPTRDRRNALALKAALRRVQPILPLVEDGSVTLIASPTHLRLDPYDLRTLDDFAHDRGASDGVYRLAHREDPLLAWYLVNRYSPVEEWVYRKTWGLDPLVDYIEAAHNLANDAGHDPAMKPFPEQALAAVFGGASERDITDALSMQQLAQNLNIVPFTRSDVVRNHLVSSSRILFGEDPALTDFQREGVAAAVTYQLPGVSNVTLGDVVRLRQNEDVYHELRTGLTELAAAVAMNGHDASYANFEAVFNELSAHYLAERFEKLEAPAKRTTLARTVASWGASGAVSLMMNAVLLAVNPDPLTEMAARAGGNLAANASKAAIDRGTVHRSREMETVRTLIGGLIE